MNVRIVSADCIWLWNRHRFFAVNYGGNNQRHKFINELKTAKNGDWLAFQGYLPVF